MTLGSIGAVYVDSDRVLQTPSLIVAVFNTVAAGDAFYAAFASSLANGPYPKIGLVEPQPAAGVLAVVRDADSIFVDVRS